MKDYPVEVALSGEFKKQATRAILSIGLFLFTYLLLIAVAFGLTVLCVLGGFALIAAWPSLFTLALGLGLASLGILVLVFLVKFVLQSRRLDKSNLVEVFRNDEPALFNMLEEIVARVGTSMPKRVYLSSEVNASVFYDSSFWSMLFPVRKNLMIGVGLVNSLSEDELKAVLSHEFGHFSQRSMKVGSYVYHVNQVIFNLLFENDGYQELIQRWAGISTFFSFFVAIAVKVISGIQAILRGLYGVVNRAYFGLSREMEFHADEMAANVTGPGPLMSALLRLRLAELALENVLAQYRRRVNKNARSENLFHGQDVMIRLLAKENEIPMRGQFPELAPELYSKFNKSKLVLKDQWASHPSIEQRVERLSGLSSETKPLSMKHAGTVFQNFERTQRVMTDHLLVAAGLPTEGTPLTREQFEQEITNEWYQYTFSKIYNGYYDYRNPRNFVIHDTGERRDLSPRELFSKEMVNKVSEAVAIQNDAVVIRQIASGEIPVKTFDYDGRKYSAHEAEELLAQMEATRTKLNQEIEENDKMIYRFFRSLEKRQNGNRLPLFYSELASLEKDFEADLEIHQELMMSLEFVHTTTPHEIINENFESLRPLEIRFKQRISALLASDNQELELTPEVRQNFEKYVSNDLVYFGVQTYMMANLELLFSVLNEFPAALSNRFFVKKRSLLRYQEELLEKVGTDV